MNLFKKKQDKYDQTFSKMVDASIKRKNNSSLVVGGGYLIRNENSGNMFGTEDGESIKIFVNEEVAIHIRDGMLASLGDGWTVIPVGIYTSKLIRGK